MALREGRRFLNAFGHGILYFRALVHEGILISISGLMKEWISSPRTENSPLQCSSSVPLPRVDALSPDWTQGMS